MITQNPSAFVQTSIVIALTALVVQAGNILALATTPTPNLAQLSLRQAAALIREPSLSEAFDIPVRFQGREPAGRRADFLEILLAEDLEVHRSRIRVVLSNDSRILLQSPASLQPGQQYGPQEVAGSDFMTPEVATSLEIASLPYMNAAFLTEEGRWIVVGEPNAFWADWRFRLAMTFLASLLFLTPAAWWVARWTTRPLRTLATQVLANNPDAAAGGATGSREVQALARAIYDLRGRLEAQLADRERMAAAMAHDLRTPLTGLRIRAEQAPEATRARMVEDIERMQIMIADIIDYAHARHAKEKIELDIVELTRSCVQEAGLLGEVEFGPSPLALRLNADPVTLRRAISNIIRNAQRYGGRAKVSLYSDKDTVEIWVEDEGSGIPVEDRDRLIEPFQRGEKSRNRHTGGAGLGLTIAREAAKDHGGKLRLKDGPNGGLLAIIEIPTRAVF